MIVMPITIDGVDLTNIALTTAPGWSMLGQIVTEDVYRSASEAEGHSASP